MTIKSKGSVIMEIQYTAGLYCRLSKDDERAGEYRCAGTIWPDTTDYRFSDRGGTQSDILLSETDSGLRQRS